MQYLKVLCMCGWIHYCFLLTPLLATEEKMPEKTKSQIQALLQKTKKYTLAMYSALLFSLHQQQEPPSIAAFVSKIMLYRHMKQLRPQDYQIAAVAFFHNQEYRSAFLLFTALFIQYPFFPLSQKHYSMLEESFLHLKNVPQDDRIHREEEKWIAALIEKEQKKPMPLAVPVGITPVIKKQEPFFCEKTGYHRSYSFDVSQGDADLKNVRTIQDKIDQAMFQQDYQQAMGYFEQLLLQYPQYVSAPDYEIALIAHFKMKHWFQCKSLYIEIAPWFVLLHSEETSLLIKEVSAILQKIMG